MLIAVFITEMVILHKYFYLFTIVIIYIVLAHFREFFSRLITTLTLFYLFFLFVLDFKTVRENLRKK